MAYFKEEIKEFALVRLHLAPETWGKSMEDVPSVVRDIGGLQDGGHLIELFNRFENFQKIWFEELYNRHALVEGHVLRGALRIVTPEDYPYYFQATRSVSRRRSYQKYPPLITADHKKALELLAREGPLTPSEFAKRFAQAHQGVPGQPKKLLHDLYNLGKVGRMGRVKTKPLFHLVNRLPCALNLEEVPELEAKKWLFLKCLSIFGPFSIKDIAHWVGWTAMETREIAELLLREKKIFNLMVEGEQETNYIRVEDLEFLHTLRRSLPERTFIRVLFNDDNLLLGYIRRLESFFGYPWRYPQFSEGVVWRGAVLKGREILGEVVPSIRASDPFYLVQKLILRKGILRPGDLERIEEELTRHADFQGKTLRMTKPQWVEDEPQKEFPSRRGTRRIEQQGWQEEIFVSDAEYGDYFAKLGGLRERIVRDLPLLPNATILDLAAGYGFFAAQIVEVQPTARITGIDLSETDIVAARKLIKKRGLEDRVRVLEMDATSLTFPPEAFDLVVNFLGLEDIHMTRGKEGVRKAFQEVARVLKPRGTFCFTAMPPEEMETEAQKIEVSLFSLICDATWLSSTEYEEMLREAGFSLLYKREYRTGRKLKALQAKEEIRFACENVPRIYGKSTRPFEEIWGKFGGRIEVHGLGHYSKVILFVAVKSS